MNFSGRLIAIGDIHGNLLKLHALVEALNPGPKDKLIFLGDYINLGPNSRGVVDYLLDLQRRVSCVFLRGDAEDYLLDALSYEDIPVIRFIQSGGGKTWKSYGGAFDKIPKKHLQFFQELKPYHVEEEFLFVHAGLRPGRGLKEQKPKDLLHIREEYIWCRNEWGKTIVSGHTPVKTPKITKDGRIFLDTGVAYPEREGFGFLTACEVKSREFVSA